MEVKFTFARGDARLPDVLTKSSFKSFSEFIIANTVKIAISPDMTKDQKKAEKAKLFWFAAPLKTAGTRRIKKNMAACLFGCGDIDESTPGAIAALMPVLSRYSMLVYQTASYTPENPRIRFVCEFSRLVEPPECESVCKAAETLLMQAAGFTLHSVTGRKKARWVKGEDYLICDRGVYGEQSYLYCPDAGAQCHSYEGAVIDVDTLPLPVLPETERNTRSTKPEDSGDSTGFDDLTEPDEHLITDLRSALWHPDMLRQARSDHPWITNGYRLASLKGTVFEDEARALWIDWSLTAADSYPDEQLDDVSAARWDNDLVPEGSSYRGIFADAQKSGWANPAALRLRAQNISKMAPSTRGELLAQHYGDVCLKADGNMVYRYTGQGWTFIPEAELRRRLSQIFRDNNAPFNPYEIKSAIETMQMQLPLMGETPRNLIGFANGVYELEAKVFRPHRKEDWLTCHNGVIYTPPADGENLKEHAPNFYRWLSHSAGGHARKMERINAALFMVLANRYDWQLFIEVTGTGGSGKSVFTGIARLLAGEENTTSGTIQDMDTARERASFVGKSLITLPDQAGYTGSGAGIKAITGGDVVRIDPKHIKPFETVIRAVVIATNNEPMRFTERQGGISRRRVIFPFTHVVDVNERDPALAEKIKAELPVIVRHLLTTFENPQDAELLLTEQRDSAEALQVKNENDPMYGFCSQLVGLPDATGMGMGDRRKAYDPWLYLYPAYIAYLDAYGFQRIPTLNKFKGDLTDTLKAFGVNLRSTRTEKGFRYNVNLAEDAKEWMFGDDEEEPLTAP
ncbi:TPA: DNA primase [Proteus mirabilis]|nr:DNA primase [Proteus mirabilis]